MHAGRGSRVAQLVAAVLSCTFMATPAGAATLSLRSEVGSEYDSNANRAETLPNGASAQSASPAPSAGGRVLIGLEGAGRLASRTLLSVSAKAAGRGYASQGARPEGVGIVQGAGSLLHAVGASTRFMATSTYYEAFQGARPDSRDFRSVSPSLSLVQDVGPGRLVLGGGYRWFAFKPSPALDFSGATVAASYRLDLSPADDETTAVYGQGDAPADWELVAAVAHERRGFTSVRCFEGEDCPPLTPRGLREDTFTQVGLDVLRTTSHLLGVGGAWQMNTSNSYGDGLVRGLAHIEATFLLPLSLSLATRAELNWTRYDQSVSIRRDPVSGLPIASIEDEGRSTLRVEVVLPLGQRFDLSARWIGYTNEIGGGPVRYRRQVFLVQLGFLLDLL